jgi:hypothetical protein
VTKNEKLNNMKKILFATFALVAAVACAPNQPRTIDWRVADLPAIDSVMGNPVHFATPLGQAVRFNGESDAYYLGENPLAGMTELTVEVIFRQHSNAKFEQRFLHMGTVNGPRVLFETRVNPDNTWHLDTFIRLDGEVSQYLILINPTLNHPCDRWYNLTVVIADGKATSYVDGVQQFTGELPYREIAEGITSIGVRQNKKSWFDGDLYRIRITPRALTTEEFLTDHKTLNECSNR